MRLRGGAKPTTLRATATSRPRSEPRATLRPSTVVVSALFHLLLVVLLVVGLHPKPPETVTPPATFALVFAHGGAERTMAPPAKKLGEPARPRSALPRAAPEVTAKAAPARPTLPVLPPVPPAPPPSTQPLPPPSRSLSAALPSPSGEPAVRLPEPRRNTPTLHATLASPRPAPRPRAVAPRAHPAPSPPRYLVMNRMSFGAPNAAHAVPSHGLNLALNRSVLNAQIANQFTIEGEIGPDWKAELTHWVNERKYYPHAAIAMGQQGAVEIRFVVERDGRVRSVALLKSSGSPFLDQAWLTLFRGADLPPFPPGTKARELTIRATMHYILID